MKLRITGLTPGITRLQLEDLLEEYGDVENLKILKPVTAGTQTIFAIVEMSREREAQEVIDNLEGYELGGGTLHFEWSSDRVKIKNPKHIEPIIDDDEDDDDDDTREETDLDMDGEAEEDL